MKNLQKLNDFKALSKDNLIEEMMKGTIKGGCCQPTLYMGAIPDTYDEENDVYTFYPLENEA